MSTEQEVKMRKEVPARSVADQSIAELGGRLSVLTRQKKDHITLDRLLERLGTTPQVQQDLVLLDIYRLVFPHAFAEEAVLWPVMRRTLPEGHEMTLQVEREHQEVNELVTKLEKLDAGSPEREPLLNRLIKVLREDVRDEEDELFPRLQTEVSVAQLRLLGLAWEVVRRVAPTRAHPVVARRPPGNIVAALPLSVLDRIRDRLDRLIHTGAGPLEGPLQQTSATLTLTAHTLERLPFMRYGEDRSTQSTAQSSIYSGKIALGLLAAGVTAFVLMRRRSQPTPSRTQRSVAPIH